MRIVGGQGTEIVVPKQAVFHVSTTSNVGLPGRWGFQLDGQPNPACDGTNQSISNVESSSWNSSSVCLSLCSVACTHIYIFIFLATCLFIDDNLYMVLEACFVCCQVRYWALYNTTCYTSMSFFLSNYWSSTCLSLSFSLSLSLSLSLSPPSSLSLSLSPYLSTLSLVVIWKSWLCFNADNWQNNFLPFGWCWGHTLLPLSQETRSVTIEPKNSLTVAENLVDHVTVGYCIVIVENVTWRG